MKNRGSIGQLRMVALAGGASSALIVRSSRNLIRVPSRGTRRAAAFALAALICLKFTSGPQTNPQVLEPRHHAVRQPIGGVESATRPSSRETRPCATPMPPENFSTQRYVLCTGRRPLLQGIVGHSSRRTPRTTVHQSTGVEQLSGSSAKRSVEENMTGQARSHRAHADAQRTCWRPRSRNISAFPGGRTGAAPDSSMYSRSFSVAAAEVVEPRCARCRWRRSLAPRGYFDEIAATLSLNESRI